MSFQFMPLYPGDYFRKTRHLTPAQHGIYCVLLMHCWSLQGPAPLNEQQLAAIVNARSADEYNSLNAVLNEFFVRMDDGWYNPRLDEEIVKAAVLSGKRRDAAMKGANARRARARQRRAEMRSERAKTYQTSPPENQEIDAGSVTCSNEHLLVHPHPHPHKTAEACSASPRCEDRSASPLASPRSREAPSSLPCRVTPDVAAPVPFPEIRFAETTARSQEPGRELRHGVPGPSPMSGYQPTHADASAAVLSVPDQKLTTPPAARTTPPDLPTTPQLARSSADGTHNLEQGPVPLEVTRAIADIPLTEKQHRANEEIAAAKRLLAFLNEKCRRNFKPVDANLKMIRARVREYGERALRIMIAIQCQAWRNDEKMCEYLRPATLFNATKCAQYVAKVGTFGGENDDRSEVAVPRVR